MGGNNQRNDDEWSGGNEDSENIQNDSNNQFSNENIENPEQETRESIERNFESNDAFDKIECQDLPPPGTDDYDQQDNSVEFSSSAPVESFVHDPPPSSHAEQFELVCNDAKSNENDDFTTNNNNFNDNNEVVENTGNTTPLCDENEIKE